MEPLKLYLMRSSMTETATLGVIFDPNTNFYLHTLELPPLNNAKNVSCIPAGVYDVKRGMYNRGGYEVFELLEVPGGRTEIKIHIGNYPKDVFGCIVVGKGKDESVPMVQSSRVAFAEFMDYLIDIDSFTLEIINKGAAISK